MEKRILVTLGPSSLKEDVVFQIEAENIYLFRINLSHTSIESLEDTITEIKKYTNVPICLDSEGAQIRNQNMINGEVMFQKDDTVKIHYSEVLGDSNNISFTPNDVARKLIIGDEMKIDFNSARIKVIEKNRDHCLAKVVVGGEVGSKKAVDLIRGIDLAAITEKDIKAIAIGNKMGIRHYALSFAATEKDVQIMRQLGGNDSCIISKIESRQGLLNLKGIIEKSDEILIDRGDLSRQVCLEKIPFLQRRIVSMVRSKGLPIYVATNLLESMVSRPEPTRAEINDVVSTLAMGANGLVLASETAIGKCPVMAVRMIRKLINQFNRWTPNTSISELLEN